MILVATLGLTWQIIPEMYALVAPGRCPLYALGVVPVDWPCPITEPEELWIVTTGGAAGEREVEGWWARIGRPVPLRWFRTRATDGQVQEEIELIRETILRVVLKAGPDAVLCIAGGRKTMSADMQRAGMAFGCRVMVHILPPGVRSEVLNAHDFASPLPPELLPQPVLVGSAPRGELLDLEPAFVSERYPIEPGTIGPPGDRWLWRDLEERERDGGSLLVNFHASVARQEHHENWRSLYRMAPGLIDRLRNTPVSATAREWLTRLPKAELHCHLGGLLDLAEQVAVGNAMWEQLPHKDRPRASADAEAWLAASQLPGGDRWPFPDRLRRAHAAACLLSQHSPSEIAKVLWQDPAPRVALRDRHPWGFKAYEHPGSLVGSTILQHPVATRACAQAIRARCRRDGLAYLEVRCSPAKYHAHFLTEFHDALIEGRMDQDPLIRVIVIADRRSEESITETIRMALDARERYGSFIAGIDLAGDEGQGDPEVIAPLFHEAFSVCLPITIHAGEGQPAANIWKSAYHLHADRIGHGLSLAQAPDLARRFRDRRICLELCPTSNREVVGYRDPDYPGSDANYPLRALMELGVPLTLCTDNPGISRTTLADEYLAAARMNPGLTWWETLCLVKQAFSHAFLPANEREDLIKRTDPMIAAIAGEIAAL